MFETRFLRLVHLFEVFENCSILLSKDWNIFYEANDHLQQFRADKLSSFFKSEAFTFSSPSLIEFIQLWPETFMANNFLQHGRRACELCHLLDLIYKRCHELFKEQYGNFPNLVKNCPFAPQASIYSHVPKSSSQKGCMNFSLNSVFSKYTANNDFPTPLKLCPFSTTSAIYLFKNSSWLCRRTGKKNKFQVARV